LGTLARFLGSWHKSRGLDVLSLLKDINALNIIRVRNMFLSHVPGTCSYLPTRSGSRAKFVVRSIIEDEHIVKIDSVKYIRLDELTRKLDVLAPPPKFNPMHVMNFDGVAPETINGRLAMIGIVPYIVVNATSNSTMLSQFEQNTALILSMSAAIIFGSLIVMVQNIKPKDKKSDIFTAYAEVVNGRVAMLGILYALIFEGF